MALANRNNPYNFDEFIEWRNQVNFYDDDTFLKKLIKHYAGNQWESLDAAMKVMSEKLSYRWNDLLETAARPENLPYMVHFNAHNHRIDRIARPKEMLDLEQEVFSEGFFSEKSDPWQTFIKLYLVCQLGEAGLACPITCTGGLVALLEKFADTPETREILKHCKEGIDGEFAIGAQYLSEIQGGSDVQANEVEAVNDGTGWRLYGTKFYCSAAHADYSVVTAKPLDSHDVALFVVPSWMPGDKEKEKRNGFSINRLKNKLGTRELPTAEITYDGAIAYPLGELNRGISNVVGVVLAHSRMMCGLGAASNITRAAREAKKYSEWRSAFGIQISNFALVALQIEQLELAAKRTAAGAFKIQSQIIRLEEHDKRITPLEIESEETKQQRFNLRQLIMLQKLVSCTDSSRSVETAMSIFGGHGLMEDFSSLPRLYRDAVVVGGAWEGPRNLLLTQIYMDMQKAAQWYPPVELIQSLLTEADSGVVDVLTNELCELLAHGDLVTPTKETLAICERWDRFCTDLFHAYQDVALNEVGEL